MVGMKFIEESYDRELCDPAGADSKMLADLRKSLPEEVFMARMRTMFGADPTCPPDAKTHNLA